MAVALLTFALVGTLSLVLTLALGYRVPGDPAAVRAHFLMALLSTTLLVMAHSFIMFFLIATGVEMKELEKQRGWGDSFKRRSVALKSRVFPLLTGALLLTMANFILGAAAHTRVIPALLHQALAWATLLVSAVALRRCYHALGENNRLIDEVGARRRADDPRT